MKKFNKIFTAVAVSLVLICSTGQMAKAQIVVSDPASLTQSILQFLQDFDRWADDVQQYEDQCKEKFDDFQSALIVAKNFETGTKTAFDILDISKQIFKTSESILTFQNYFSANSCTAYYYKCKALKSSYSSIAQDYINNVKDQFIRLSSMKSASGLDYLNTAKAIAEDLQVRMNSLSEIILGDVADLYDNYMFSRNADANSEFLRTVIY